MSDTPRYWFKAKQFGWGWGLPATWEGWVLFAAFLVGFILIPSLVRGPAAAFIAAAALVLFIGIAWRKGEPPRWRWGKD